MFTNRLFILIVALTLLTMAWLNIQAGNAAPATVSNDRDYIDYALRHPGLVSPEKATVESDWFERHPGYTIGAPAPDLSDYFQRHPDVIKPVETADLSDWYLRHRGSQ